MANEYIGTTETNVIVPEVWSQRFYDVKLAKLPFNDSIDESYEGEIRDLGDIINISTIPELDEAIELAEGAAGDSEAVTLTGQQLTINKRTYKDVIVTKKSLTQSLPFMDKLRDKIIYSIMKRMQALIIATISPSASSPDHVISYDSGSTLGLADALEAKELLDTANVDVLDRVCVLGAAQINDVFNITGFVSKDYIPAGSPLSSGQVPTELVGFIPKQTTVVSNTSYWFHPMFMSMAVQQQLNIEQFNLGADGVRGQRINTDILWGLKQLDDERVVSIS